MPVVQCSGQVRGPKRGRIYVYDARPCKRRVTVPEGQTIGFCRDHDRNGYMARTAARWQVTNDARKDI